MVGPIDDVENGGRAPVQIPVSTIIPANGYTVIYAGQLMAMLGRSKTTFPVWSHHPFWAAWCWKAVPWANMRP
jgi:hypothetical protein